MAQHIKMDAFAKTLETGKEKQDFKKTISGIENSINRSKFLIGTSMKFEKLGKEYKLYPDVLGEEVYKYETKKYLFEIHIDKENKRFLDIYVII